MANKRYIGDGVYAEWDDAWLDQLILYTDNGIAITNKIYLEPEVIENLLRYLQAKKSGS